MGIFRSSFYDPSDGLMRLLRGVEVASRVNVLSTASFASPSTSSEEQFTSNDLKQKSYLYRPRVSWAVRACFEDIVTRPLSACHCVACPALPARQQDTCGRCKTILVFYERRWVVGACSVDGVTCLRLHVTNEPHITRRSAREREFVSPCQD